jgi:hypothetical protein
MVDWKKESGLGDWRLEKRWILDIIETNSHELETNFHEARIETNHSKRFVGYSGAKGLN